MAYMTRTSIWAFVVQMSCNHIGVEQHHLGRSDVHLQCLVQHSDDYHHKQAAQPLDHTPLII